MRRQKWGKTFVYWMTMKSGGRGGEGKEERAGRGTGTLKWKGASVSPEGMESGTLRNLSGFAFFVFWWATNKKSLADNYNSTKLWVSMVERYRLWNFLSQKLQNANVKTVSRRQPPYWIENFYLIIFYSCIRWTAWQITFRENIQLSSFLS